MFFKPHKSSDRDTGHNRENIATFSYTNSHGNAPDRKKSHSDSFKIYQVLVEEAGHLLENANQPF